MREPQPAPEPQNSPVEPASPPIDLDAPQPLPWNTPSEVWHGIRVLCDLAGLRPSEKDLLCACVYQESAFNNAARCENRDADGTVWSTDWGICQINDWFHIGQGKDFPSVEYVLANPDKAFEFMIKMYEAGQLKQWVSFSSDAYKKWLQPDSPMWNLRSAV
jgi:hypothetical protein